LILLLGMQTGKIGLAVGQAIRSRNANPGRFLQVVSTFRTMGLTTKSTASMEWEASPSPTVFRKRLELLGEKESGRVTSVVKYEKASNFRKHPHPDGEEILVLDGVFTDEHGDWPAGTYLLNPEGFEHAPSSREGCVLFVKLKQFPGLDREHVVIDTTNTSNWEEVRHNVIQCKLYPPKDLSQRKSDGKYEETMDLFKLEAETEMKLERIDKGLEVYVIEGDLIIGTEKYTQGDWIKFNPEDIPPEKIVTISSDKSTSIYVKRNHLAARL